MAERALQTGLGVEAAIGARWDTEVTGFYHGLSNLIVGREDAFQFLQSTAGRTSRHAALRQRGCGTHLRRGDVARYTDERTLAWLRPLVAFGAA